MLEECFNYSLIYVGMNVFLIICLFSLFKFVNDVFN